MLVLAMLMLKLVLPPSVSPVVVLTASDWAVPLSNKSVSLGVPWDRARS